MELLGYRAGGADPGNTSHAFQLVHQALIQQLGQSDGILAFHGHRCHHHRQHRGVDLQHIGSADHIIPLLGQGGNALLNVHTHSVQVDTFFKLHDQHTVVFR